MAWFQDGTKLLISGPLGPKERTGIWIYPLDGSAPRKLIDNARSAVMSPDDSQIAYFAEGAIWLVKASGEGARKIIDAPPGYSLDGGGAFSPDSRRVAYGKRKPGDFSIDSYNLDTGQTSVIVSDPAAGDFCWARDDRIIYSRQEDRPNETSANLWDIRVDPRTARARGKPRRLTNWGGYLFYALSTNVAGTRLSFVRTRFRSTVYVGELEAGGTRLRTPRRHTFDEWLNWPTAWSRDSHSVLLTSDRGGRLDIFRQNEDGSAPVAIVTGGEERRDARFSPDGRWILFLSSSEAEGQGRAPQAQLMRVAVDGGAPQRVMPVAGYSGHTRVATAGTATVFDSPRFRCPAAPHSPCVLSETIRNQVVFTAFDPVEGRKQELARIGAPLPEFWDLSPNGQWIVFGRLHGASIRLLSLAGRPARDIPLTEWNVQCVAWAADGNALFATAWASKDAPLLRISLDGEVSLLRKVLFHAENPVPSPDGRYLAFGESTMESNVWVVQNLR